MAVLPYIASCTCGSSIKAAAAADAAAFEQRHAEHAKPRRRKSADDEPQEPEVDPEGE